MTASQIKIRKEQAPVRCEVCHQTDCFDSFSEVCTRCSNLLPIVPVFSQPVVPCQLPRFLLEPPTGSIYEEAARGLFYFACFWPIELLLLIGPIADWNDSFPDYAIPA